MTQTYQHNGPNVELGPRFEHFNTICTESEAHIGKIHEDAFLSFSSGQRSPVQKPRVHYFLAQIAKASENREEKAIVALTG